MVPCYAVILKKSCTLRLRQFRNCFLNRRHPVHNPHRNEIGLREIAIVVLGLLCPHRNSDAAQLIEVPRLLHNNLAAAQHISLAHDLE